MNCPFYGRMAYQSHLYGAPALALLLATQGNQCALVTTVHSPCMFDAVQADWRACPRVGDMLVGPVLSYPAGDSKS